MFEKKSKETQEIEKLKELVQLQDREIKDIKLECAQQFKTIRDLCVLKQYNDFDVREQKLKKVYEIATGNFAALFNDLVGFEEDEHKKENKIIELPNTRKSKQ